MNRGRNPVAMNNVDSVPCHHARKFDYKQQRGKPAALDHFEWNPHAPALGIPVTILENPDAWPETGSVEIRHDIHGNLFSAAHQQSLGHMQDAKFPPFAHYPAA
jgi:hypothetical protein